MTIDTVFIDFGGVIVRTEDKAPRAHAAERAGLTTHELEKIIFESESSQRASTGEIPEEAHWQAVADALRLSRSEADKVTAEFFAGDRADQDLLTYLRSLRPARKVCLISNAWSGLRLWISGQGFADVFDHMVISAEVGLMKPDARLYRLALEDGRARMGAVALANLVHDDGLTGDLKRAWNLARPAIRLIRGFHPSLEPSLWRTMSRVWRAAGRETPGRSARTACGRRRTSCIAVSNGSTGFATISPARGTK
jgi:putative hydrolase of the HAD superfamily